MDRTASAPKNFRIVALCGSSGALTALVQILRVVPHDSGMAFVVLTHRRTRSTSQLIRLLSLATKMPVQQIENRGILLPNRVYVTPPGKDLTTDGIVFQLVPISTVIGLPNGFDIFLTSLARNTNGRAVTIILSGMASDGSAALGDLRRGGGLAFAQSDAEIESMPKSAVATGNVDYFCAAADIGTLISGLRLESLSQQDFGCHCGLFSDESVA